MNKTKAEKFFSSITKFSCVSNMNDDDKIILKNIINRFYDKIVSVPAIREIDFTPHEESHLQDIYNIISKIFVEGFKNDKKLTHKELLLLNISVLFHDIGMHDTELDINHRDNHAREAKKYVLENLNGNDLEEIGGREGIDIIAEICAAHSEANGGFESYDIKEVRLYNDESQGEIGEIRVLLLSVILRIADELDICVNRINSVNESKIKDNSTEKFRESHRKHWQLCRLFNMPDYDAEKNLVVLKIKTGGFYETDNKNTYSEKFDLIKKYLIKLHGKNEGNEILELLNGKHIRLQEKYTSLLDKYKDKNNDNLIANCNSLNFSLAADDENCISWGKYYFNYIQPNRQRLTSAITLMKHGNILGHKSLNYLGENSPCIYDHMNFHKLVDSGEMQIKIYEIINDTFGKIISEINSQDDSNSIIIGIDSIGCRLAIMLGNELKLPILPYASKSRKSVYPQIEISDDIADKWYKNSVNGKTNFYIICDNIYTFDSIANCLKRLGLWDDKLINKEAKIYIFCLFDHKPLNEDYFSDNSGRNPKYEKFQKNFKIYSIFDKMKTNFVRHDACIFCMLKKGVAK